MEHRAGKLTGRLRGEAAYQAFTPSGLPPSPALELDGEAVQLLVQANKGVALLAQKARQVPSVQLFICMYVRKEALMSSQIEGTQATLEDVLDPSVGKNANRDVADVVNYIRATDFAIGKLSEWPLCNRLIKRTHEILMQGARGQERTPGEFRRSQNWIGGVGSGLKDARYVPPAPEDMQDAMSDLEKYMNADDGMDVLVQAALIHYQFETIHPFLDGNGRIGRLMVTLFLIVKEVLSEPVLYISYFLKKNRSEYYDRLTQVRETGDYEQWVKFFLRAVKESAADAAAVMDELIILHDKNISSIRRLGRAGETGLKLFAYLEENPIIMVRQTASALELSFKAVNDSVQRLCDLGILVQTGSEGRNRQFCYRDYLDILRNGT